MKKMALFNIFVTKSFCHFQNKNLFSHSLNYCCFKPMLPVFPEPLLTSQNVGHCRFLKTFSKSLTLPNLNSKSHKEKKSIIDVKTTKNTAETEKHKYKWLTVPNVLTISRVILTPPLGYCVLEGSFMVALGIFIYAGLTDLLDGLIARSFQSQTSVLGSIIDPLADKLLISTLFITLAIVNLIPLPLVLLVLSRDLALTTAGFYLRYCSLPARQRGLREVLDVRNETVKFHPTLISKFNTAVQLTMVAATLASAAFDHSNNQLIPYLWLLTATTTISSGVVYIFAKDSVQFISKYPK